MRWRLVEGETAEAPPGDGVGHLAAQRLVAEAVAVLEEHHPQVGLDGDRRPADHRVEKGAERLEEPLVVEQLVDLNEVARQSQAALGRMDSHSVSCGFIVLSTVAPISCATGGWSHRDDIRGGSRAP